MENRKTTKKQYFEALRTVVETMDAVGDYSTDEVLEFIDAQVAQLDAKAEKAKARAAKKSAEGDELRTKIAELLTDEYQIADDITAAIDDEDITKSKVVARLGQLVKAGQAEKAQVKTEDGRKLMAYRIAGVTDDTEVEE